MARSTVVEEEELETRKPRARARSYKVAVKTKTKREEWAFNELRFPSRGAADNYAADLERRWSIVVATEVQPSDDPSNANYPVPNDRYDVPR